MLEPSHTRLHSENSRLTLKLDRLRFSASVFPRVQIRSLPGFRCERDHRLRESPYGRVLVLASESSGTKISCRYGRRVPWVAPCELTLIGNDDTGLKPRNVFSVLEVLPDSRLLMIELAFDFDPGWVSTPFVWQYGRFGKSRLHNWSGNAIWFGSRRSTKFVRAYRKSAINAYRVELEVHRTWLRKHNVWTVFDFFRLPGLICPKHIHFCALNWRGVGIQIQRKSSAPKLALRHASWLKNRLPFVLDFLRHQIGLQNTHRLLVPLKVNLVIREALESWAREWPRAAFRLRRSAQSCRTASFWMDDGE
jgi:hypothetical protein